jgi:hypothetical protein
MAARYDAVPKGCVTRVVVDAALAVFTVSCS